MPDNCPSAADLLLYALGQAESVAPGLAQHLDDCERCRSEVVALRQTGGQLRAQSVAAALTGQCLDELGIAELVEGTGDEVRRAPLLAHVAACAACRAAVASLSRLLAEPAVRSEAARIAVRPWRARGRRLAGLGGAALAAAAVLLLLVSGPWRTDRPAAPDLRELTVTLSVPPAPVTPAGPVETRPLFVWTSVPRASRFHLTLFDARGSIVWETETADTSVVVPDSIVLTAGAPYLWQVRARIGWDRWSESRLTEFTVAEPSSSAPR